MEIIRTEKARFISRALTWKAIKNKRVSLLIVHPYIATYERKWYEVVVESREPESREPESRDPDIWFSRTYFTGCAQIWKHTIQGLQDKDHPKRLISLMYCTTSQNRYFTKLY